MRAEFSFEPHASTALDALYLARPELRGKVALLLGISIAGMVAGMVTAIAGADLAVWATFLAFGPLALMARGWWALMQCRGSVFAASPGTVYIDDHGLLVRPVSGEPSLLPWSTLRGWAESERIIVLLPCGRSGRPLHVIPASAVEASETALVFRDLLLWHLGKPKG